MLQKFHFVVCVFFFLIRKLWGPRIGVVCGVKLSVPVDLLKLKLVQIYHDLFNALIFTIFFWIHSNQSGVMVYLMY